MRTRTGTRAIVGRGLRRPYDPTCSTAPTSPPPAVSRRPSTGWRRSGAPASRCSRRARRCGSRPSTRRSSSRASGPAAGRRGPPRIVPRALPRQPRELGRRGSREITRRAAGDDGDRARDRRRRGRVPRRLAPRPGFDPAVGVVAAAVRQLLELTTERLWLCIENTAGAGGTIGRSVDELAALADAAGAIHASASASTRATGGRPGVDVADPEALDAALGDLDERIGLERLRVLHVNDSATPLGSNRDRHELVGEGLIGDGLATFLSHPAFDSSPRSSRRGWTRAHERRISTGCARSAAAASAAGAAEPSAGVVDAREDPERRALARELVELGVPAAELVLAARVALDDLDLAHRERGPARTDRPKPPRSASAAWSSERSISTSNTFCRQPMYVRPHAS